MIAAMPGSILWLSIPGVTLPLTGFFSGVEKAMNRMRQGPIESAQRCKRHIDKPMPASSFHQLSNAASMIDMHDNEQTVRAGHLDNLTRCGDFFGTTIRFNNNAGNIGTHRTPQQISDFRRPPSKVDRTIPEMPGMKPGLFDVDVSD
jgi:hypothetical protein